MTLSILATLVALALAGPCSTAMAEWPERPIQMVVPFPAGGTIDVVARQFAQALATELRQPVTVINREGGSGTIGAVAVANAAPDGYTLAFMPNGPLTVQPALNRKLSYSLARFKGICQVFSYPYALAVRQDSSWHSLKDFVAAAKASKKELSYGFGGVGTAPHFAMLQLSQATGVKFLGAPYRGDPPVAVGLKGGEVDAAVLTIEVAAKLGFRVLAVFADGRMPTLPQVPTAREQGSDVSAVTFAGLVAPAGLPADAARRLESACATAAKSNDFVAGMTRSGQAIDLLAGDRFDAALRADEAEKRRLIDAVGMALEK